MTYEFAIEHGGAAGDPVLLLLHSTGGDEHQLLGVGREVAPTAALVAPRGQVMEGGVTRRFFARRSTFDLDIDDLHARVAELASWMRQVLPAEGLDDRPVIALGYSNGANVAVEMLLAHPGLLAGAVLLRPLLPYDPEGPPTLDGVRVLVLAGAHDPFAAPAVTDRLAEVLRAGGAQVDVVLRDAGHEVVPDDVADAARWMQAQARSAG